MDKVIAFLKALVPLLNPFANDTKNQVLGTVFTVICTLLSVAILVLQTWGGGCSTPKVSPEVYQHDVPAEVSYDVPDERSCW